MKNVFILLLLISYSTINAQVLSEEEIRNKGIKRMRIYKLEVPENGYSKPSYKKEELVYEYTYDTLSRQIVTYRYSTGISSSLSYHTRIEKDSIFNFDSLDRPLSVKTCRIHIHNDVFHYKVSKLILIQKYRYDDVLGIKEIHSVYENGETAFREFFYTTLQRVTYKTGYEKFDGEKKLLEQNITEYDSSYREIRRIKYDPDTDKSPVVVNIEIAPEEEIQAPSNQTEIQIDSAIVTKINSDKNQLPFSFHCSYKDSVQLKIQCTRYHSWSGDTHPELLLQVSLYHDNRLYERKDVLISTIPDTNNLHETFIKQLVYCSGNEENVKNICKYDAHENLKFTLKSRWRDDFYNGYYEYDFYDESQQDKNADYIDHRKNGNGKVIQYTNGNKYKEANYLHYQLHGPSTTWHTNGKISIIEEFSEDLLNGPSITYDTSGKITIKEFYKDGAPIGIVEYFKEDGSSGLTMNYYLITEKKGSGNILVVSHPLRSPLREEDKRMMQLMRKRKKEYLNDVRR